MLALADEIVARGGRLSVLEGSEMPGQGGPGRREATAFRYLGALASSGSIWAPIVVEPEGGTGHAPVRGSPWVDRQAGGHADNPVLSFPAVTLPPLHPYSHSEGREALDS